MEPEIAKRIATSADGQELMKYLSSLVAELDSVERITQDDPVEIAVEVKARKIASAKLKKVLSGLLTAKQYGILEKKVNEYAA